MPKKITTDTRRTVINHVRALIIIAGLGTTCMVAADNYAPAKKNALVIQADIAGLVMTGCLRIRAICSRDAHNKR